jgi:hypothetical protein
LLNAIDFKNNGKPADLLHQYAVVALGCHGGMSQTNESAKPVA